MSEKKKTLAVDFDGVIHDYSRGWLDGSIYDPPRWGAKEALTKLRERYEIVIWSTRCHERTINGVHEPSQAAEVEAYLKKHEIPYDRIHTEPGKPFCFLLIDDRAIQFRDWLQTLADVEEFEKRMGVA